ncbi:hypothetical protein VME0621_04727 [Vibrio mediterranei]|jgi:hypothetical protein|nr:hypothetical protein VSAK1_19269 [Vibrio mediterranei AK1]SBO12570.1 hypothetical protein VME0621_04727 [Vibrio mediterranei]
MGCCNKAPAGGGASMGTALKYIAIIGVVVFALAYFFG